MVGLGKVAVLLRLDVVQAVDSIQLVPIRLLELHLALVIVDLLLRRLDE